MKKLVALQIRHNFGPSIRRAADMLENWELLPDLHPEVARVTSVEDFTREYGEVDLVTAFVPCKTFSLAAISYHWEKDALAVPKSDIAKHDYEIALRVVDQLMALPDQVTWFLENPTGVLRKFIEHDRPQFPKGHIITQCTYDEENFPSPRQKPTVLWTNILEPNFRPRCKRGDPCHVSAPAGSSTGTQGLSTEKKAELPLGLQMEFFKLTEKRIRELE